MTPVASYGHRMAGQTWLLFAANFACRAAADWDRVLDINTRRALYALQASPPPMSARG
jgi:hypothetical protein